MGLQGKEGPLWQDSKHKLRLGAKGYVQRQGVDYDMVFAQVAHMETV